MHLTSSEELDLFNGWCQRWDQHEDCWRHVDDETFQPHRYQVVPLAHDTARKFTLAHHYSRAWPAAKLPYGLIEDGAHLVGTCVLGVPMSPAVLTNPFPALEPYQQSVELSRLVILDRVPANAESWFVARVFRDISRMGVRGVVAFSDPVRRRIGDRPLMPGHVGTVYQALGAVYTGRGTARKLTVLPGGLVFPDRSRQKIIGGEQGANGAIARLVDMGAPPKPAGMPGWEWLPVALAAIGARKVWHPGNHRYCWTIGPRWARRAYPVALPSLPFPKRPDEFEITGPAPLPPIRAVATIGAQPAIAA
ncbi:Mom family adenine methylcarbamoylation protein [Actinoplanes derwentensis]|uniref:Uncharacterized protein n=1 Tax=Actinoplanes derwentensis TaxID=113562 RepID=A0A1H2CUK0_9ACTN|nr:hypothetical protein [Actinoplanes derwentensis]GID81952.1 hypothetical protein Ade03nite_08760 [Actinoplanes derwentensis]SDT74175.1 hypothetical protein SAMN04489716_6901 [Actinoplanes derwentensis]